MIPGYEKILNFVKESTKTFFIVGGTCFVLIFFSDQVGTEAIRDAINPILKVFFIICLLGIFYSIGRGLFSLWKTYVDRSTRRKNSIRRINSLTKYEKFILEMYVKEGVRSKSLDSNDGSVVELERAGIIFQSTQYMDFGSNCKYNVTDWAWDYINKRPEFVCESPPPKVIKASKLAQTDCPW